MISAVSRFADFDEESRPEGLGENLQNVRDASPSSPRTREWNKLADEALSYVLHLLVADCDADWSRDGNFATSEETRF
jgi:hypothetical protein